LRLGDSRGERSALYNTFVNLIYVGKSSSVGAAAHSFAEFGSEVNLTCAYRPSANDTHCTGSDSGT
jgi:hypothetical protein